MDNEPELMRHELCDIPVTGEMLSVKAKKRRLTKRRQLEIEVKLKVKALKKIRSGIVALGFEEKVHRAFEDNWILDFPNRSLYQNRCLLRLREFNGKCWVTFKEPSQNSTYFKVREELETEVAEKTTLYKILGRLGLRTAFRYQKYRSIFEPEAAQRLRKVTLVLDETPIGNYLEIEGSPKEIKTIAGRLGYSKHDFIKESYADLYAKLNPSVKSQGMIFRRPR
jgi:adenylate cyclase class 2